MTVASAIPKSDTAPSCFSFQSSNMSRVVSKVWLNRLSVRFNDAATIYSTRVVYLLCQNNFDHK
jgi:hypothetical protein